MIRNLKLGQSIVVAITFEEYKKQHPNSKKTKDDPMFNDNGSKSSPKHNEDADNDELADLHSKYNRMKPGDKGEKELDEQLDTKYREYEKKYGKKHKNAGY